MSLFTEPKAFTYYNINDLKDIVGFLEKTIEKNEGKKYQSLKKYDIERIIKVVKRESQKLIDKEAELIDAKLKYEKGKKIAKAHSERMELFSVLWENLVKHFPEDYKPTGGLTGSWIRQFIEFPLAQSKDFEDPGYGNAIGHDLDIVMYTNLYPSDKEYVSTYFNKAMKKFQDHVSFSILNPELCKPITITNKSLIQVIDVTILAKDIKESDPIGKKALIDIPHSIFKFKDNNDNSIIEIDVIAFKPESAEGWTNIDFNVNGLMMSDRGIEYCGDIRSGFLATINSIINKEPICLINFESIVENATKPGMLRTEKVPYFMQIAWMLRNRYKICSVGYKNIVSFDKLINHSINTEDDCPITGCKAPYYEIKLNCSHKISLMAYIGIMEESKFDSSQAIKCPLCRADFSLELIEKKPTPINIFELKTLSEIFHNKFNDCKLEEKEEEKLTSEDAESFVLEIINKKPSITLPANNILDVSDILPTNTTFGRGRSRWDNS